MVKTSAARMPSNCRGKYRHIALMEVERGAGIPTMISLRAKGVVRVVRKCDRLHAGATLKSQYRQIVQRYETLAEILNHVLNYQHIPLNDLTNLLYAIESKLDEE